MNRFYVYAYLRAVDLSPYYIGKGTKRRIHEKHSWNLPKDLSRRVILKDKLSEDDALKLEAELIKQYGRKDLGTGILRNMTDGGDGGTSGRIVSQKTKNKLSEKAVGRKFGPTPESRKEKIRLANSGENNHFFGKTHSRKTKKIMSEKKKGKTYEEIYGAEVAAEKKRKTSAFISERNKGPQKQVSCPHCNKTGGVVVMGRWHFDNCKNKL